MFVPETHRDSHLLHVTTIADPQQMKMLFQQHLPRFREGELHIDQLKIRRFQYKPGRSCEVCYVLSVNNRLNGEQGTQLLYGLVDSNGEARAAHQISARLDVTPLRFGPAIYYLDHLDMALWGFPNDPVMAGLPKLLEVESLGNLLKIHGACRASIQFRSLKTDVVKYVPGTRCVIEHRLWHHPAATEAPDIHLFSKTYGSGRGATAFNILRTLWRSDAREQAILNVPQPLFYDPQLRVLVTPALVGEEAFTCFLRTGNRRIFTQIGHLLAAFHQTQLPEIQNQSVDKISADLEEVTHTLSQLAVPSAQKAVELHEALQDRAGMLPDMPTTPVHGAFRINQIKLVDKRATLFDFDGVYLGNPMSDVGSFVAHLHYLTLKRDLSASACQEAIQHFCRAYADSAPWGVPQDALNWTVAALLVGKHVKKLLKRGRMGGESQRSRTLARAQDVLAGMEVAA